MKKPCRHKTGCCRNTGGGQGCCGGAWQNIPALRGGIEKLRGVARPIAKYVARRTRGWWGGRNPRKTVEPTPKNNPALKFRSLFCPSFCSHHFHSNNPILLAAHFLLPTTLLGSSPACFRPAPLHFPLHSRTRTQTRWLPPSVSTWARPTRVSVSFVRIGKFNPEFSATRTGCGPRHGRGCGRSPSRGWYHTDLQLMRPPTHPRPGPVLSSRGEWLRGQHANRLLS